MRTAILGANPRACNMKTGVGKDCPWRDKLAFAPGLRKKEAMSRALAAVVAVTPLWNKPHPISPVKRWARPHPRTMKLPLDKVHKLWDELSEFPATEALTACAHLMRTLSGWVDGDRPAWLGVVRLLSGRAALKDSLRGWRQGALFFVDPLTPQELALSREADTRTSGFGMTTEALAATCGAFRAHRMRDGFVDFKAFEKTEHYQRFYTNIGVCDRIWVGMPVTTQAESFFLIDRRNRSKRFTASELKLAAYTLRGVLWFHRRLMLEHGLGIAQKPLSPQERRVLRELLTGKVVKQIADDLGLSLHTAGDHIKSIFKKLGINSRTELMALWLRGG